MLKPIRRRLKPLLSLLPLPGLILVIILLNHYKVFTVKRIDCVLDNFPCTLIYEPALVGLHGQSLFTVKDKLITVDLKTLDPTLTDVAIRKILPDKLSLVLKRSPAIAQVVQAGRWWHLDAVGNLVALPGQPNPALPVIEAHDQVALNANLMGQVINALNAAYVSFTGLVWQSDSMVTIKTVVGPVALINPQNPISPAIATLQYLLSNLKIGEKVPTTIDLRFVKPILNY